MDDPNTAAAANAVNAGNAFWGRVQQFKENQMQKTRLGLLGKQVENETARNKSELETADITRQLLQQQIAQAGVATAAAKKNEFLQGHNPVPGATQASTDAYATKMKLQATTPTVDMGGDWVEFPFPKSEPEATRLGIPFAENNPTTWRMPRATFDQRVQNAAATPTEDFENTPFDELSSEAQQHIVSDYQKNAPAGVKVSPAEAAMTYRMQQRQKNPPFSPAEAGLVPTGGEYNPMNPSSLKLNLTRPIQGSLLTPEQYKDFGEPLGKSLSENAELRLSQVKAGHVANVIDYANDPHPTVSSDKSLIMSYLKTIDPTVRVSEGTVTTVMDNMGLPEEIKNSVAKLMTGSLFTPEHRQWFSTAAQQNLDNARETARNSIESQLSISGATGNPLANTVRLPPNVLPPGGQRGRGPGHGTSDVASGGSSAPVSEGVRKFSTMEQAKSAKLPSGTVVLIYDPGQGRYRQAINE